jgi:hypothetical protein
MSRISLRKGEVGIWDQLDGAGIGCVTALIER